MAVRAFVLEDVGAVGAIHVSAPAAAQLINFLEVVRAWLPSVADDNLVVFVDVARLGSFCRHAGSLA